MSSLDLLLWLLFAAAKVGVLLAFAAGVACALRRGPARVRHTVWAVALGGSLLLPLVGPWLPSWALWTRPAPIVEPAAEASSSTSGAAVRLEKARESGSTPTARAASDSAKPRPASALRGWAWPILSIPPAAWLLGMWLAGGALILARLALSLRAVRHLERGARAVDPEWDRALERARERVGVRRPVKLLVSPKVATPMTWGALEPVLLLPEKSRSWDAERRRIVLHHELAHVRRGDWLARLAARLVCALYWINPLVWVASRRLVLEQEKACDETVVELGDRPSSYARHLLAIADTMRQPVRTPALAMDLPLDMARRSQMEGRLMSILDGSRRRGGRALIVPALLLIVGLVPALAAVEPWAEEPAFGAQLSAEETPGRAPMPVASPAPQPDAAPQVAPRAAVQQPQSVPSTAPVDTSAVERALAELERLARAMEPYEVELEAIEAEMEPFEAELERVEDGMEPFDAELDAYERELEPFEERLEAIEFEMEPYEERLQAIETELEPYESRLDALDDELEPYEGRLDGVETELEPFEERLEAVEAEMEPLQDRLDAIEDEVEPFEDRLDALEDEMDPLDDEMDRLSDQYEVSDSAAEREALRARMQEIRRQMQPIRERMQDARRSMAPTYERLREVHRELQPYYDRMQEIHREMEPIHERMQAIHREMEPVHERLTAIHEEMSPIHDRMSAVYDEMGPLYERMSAIHREMEPVHEKMSAVHERMTPVHEAMGAHHERMEPFYRKMGEIHERMRPLHEEMAAHHEALEEELVGVVVQLLVTELEGVVEPGADFAGVAREVVEDSSMWVDDGRLRVRSSPPALREVVRRGFTPAASEADFAAAVDRFVEAFANLELEASQ